MMPALDYAQRPAKLAAQKWNGSECAVPPLAAQGWLWQQSDAQIAFDGFLDILDIVELEGHLDSDPLLAQETVHFFADHEPLVETDIFFARKFTGRNKQVPGQRMPGRTGEHHLFLPPGHGDQLAHPSRERHQA